MENEKDSFRAVHRDQTELVTIKRGLQLGIILVYGVCQLYVEYICT